MITKVDGSGRGLIGRIIMAFYTGDLKQRACLQADKTATENVYECEVSEQ
jgi:hypothetical protein